jgi:DNA-binding MarR family transcriptional regulator
MGRVTAASPADDASTLARQAGEAVFRIARQLDRAVGLAGEPEQLTPLAARVLLATGEPVSQRQLGRSLGIGPAQVSVITTELVERGLVERKGDSADHRLRRPQLTARGRAAVGRINTRMARSSPLGAALDERQLRSLLRALERVERAPR